MPRESVYSQRDIKAVVDSQNLQTGYAGVSQERWFNSLRTQAPEPTVSITWRTYLKLKENSNLKEKKMPQGTQSSDLLQIDAALEASLVALEDGLCIYAKDGLMDNRTVVKLFKEVKLCDMKKITVTDVDLGFAKFKTKGQAKMAPGEVVVLVEHLCQKAGKDFRQMVEVLTMHAEQGQDFKNVEVKAGQNRGTSGFLVFQFVVFELSELSAFLLEHETSLTIVSMHM